MAITCKNMSNKLPATKLNKANSSTSGGNKILDFSNPMVNEIKNIKNSLKITYPQILDFKADQEKLSDVRDVIESFYFYDVKKSLDSYPDNLPTLSYVTKDGMILSISSVSPE